MKSKVATASCSNYNSTNVQTAVSKVVNDLGGMASFVPQNSKVFVKVNLVRDMPPESAGTTHPEVVIAVVNELEKLGCSVTVGDSSGGVFTKGYMNNVYSKCKMTDVATRTNAVLNSDFDYKNVAVNGKVLQKLDVINCFLDADVVINVTKLKTHSFAGYTGAVKNLYGLIPGLVKVEMHSRFPDLNEFCDLLIDIEQFAKKKIVLHVIDAVMGMEGDGPTNGKPVFIGQILASANPYALDSVAVSLFQNPLETPLLCKAVERGLLAEDLSDVDFDFEGWKSNYIEGFDTVKVVSTDTFLHMPKWVKKLAKKNLTKKVRFSKKICRGCGKCAMHCPAKAITVIDGKAHVNQKKCIRCYCCQELCPFDAVKFRKPLLYRIVRGFSRSKSSK